MNLLQKVAVSMAAGAFEMVKTYKEIEEARTYNKEGEENPPRKIGFIKQ
jgi:hypothetical protein|tara:strand:+ start:479 stop:625 length:147 start_codon:yes stop_codon:yes gene_type:complete